MGTAGRGSHFLTGLLPTTCYLLERFPQRSPLVKWGRQTFFRAPKGGSLCCKTSAGVRVLCAVAVIEVFSS